MKNIKCSTVLVAVALILIIGTWCAMAVRESGRVAEAEAKLAESAQQPAQSVEELVERYRATDLTPSQRRMIKAGLYPDKVHPITISR